MMSLDARVFGHWRQPEERRPIPRSRGNSTVDWHKEKRIEMSGNTTHRATKLVITQRGSSHHTH